MWVVNKLRVVPKFVYEHLLKFAAQTALHGPKYLLNRGYILGGKDKKGVGDPIKLKISRFDR